MKEFKYFVSGQEFDKCLYLFFLLYMFESFMQVRHITCRRSEEASTRPDSSGFMSMAKSRCVL